ncbi:MAG: hypothetical protein ABIS18_05140 [Actinomycetota bacterium]
MKKLLVVVFALAAILLPSAAFGGIDSSVGFTSPTPPPGEVVGTHRVVASAQAQSSIKSFSLHILPDPAETSIPPLGPSAQNTVTFDPGVTNYAELDLMWDTVTLTPYNGMYVIKASVYSHVDSSSSDASVQNLAVNNPPAQPSGVRVKLDKSDIPLITWFSNKEPDLVGYEVLRTAGNNPPVRIATTQALSYRDVKAPKDVSLSYEVVAVRYSPVTPSSGIKTVSSPTSSLIIASAEEAPRPTLPDTPIVAAQPPLVLAPRIGPRRDLGFDPLLPYSEPIPQRFKDPQIPDNPIEALANPATFVQGRVHVPPYMAAALLLLVLALHLGRMAHKFLTVA